MSDKKELKKIIGLLSTATVACVATGVGTAIGQPLGSALMSSVLGGLSVNLASGFIENIKYAKIKEWFIKTHPDKLNHDLQKALKKSILRALGNIGQLYEVYLKDYAGRKKIKEGINKLQEEVEKNFPDEQKEELTSSELKDYLYDDVETATNELLKRLPMEFDGLDELNANVPFSGFFKENLLRQLQLCFGEELKERDNHRVWVAFQRLIAEDTKQKIELVIKQQEAIKEDLNEIKGSRYSIPKLNKNQIKRLTELAIQLNKPLEFSERFQKALDDTLVNLKTEITGINKKLDALANTSIRIDEKVTVFHQDLKAKWLPKKMVYVYSVLLLLTIALIFILNYFNSKTFSATMVLVPDKKLNISKEYPPLKYPAILNVYLSGQESFEINSKGETILQNIESEFLNRKIAVMLDDPYWKASSDSITLSNEINDILISPNDVLAIVEGEIRSQDGTEAISNALVYIGNDTIVSSNENGIFKVVLPYYMRKEIHKLTVNAIGYKSSSEYYYPKSGSISIRLNR